MAFVQQFDGFFQSAQRFLAALGVRPKELPKIIAPVLQRRDPPADVSPHITRCQQQAVLLEQFFPRARDGMPACLESLRDARFLQHKPSDLFANAQTLARAVKIRV